MDNPGSSKPLTTEDLYGKSKPADLVYEETPEIIPIIPNTATSPPPAAETNTIKDMPITSDQPSPSEVPQTQLPPQSPRRKSSLPLFIFLLVLGLGSGFIFRSVNFQLPNFQNSDNGTIKNSPTPIQKSNLSSTPSIKQDLAGDWTTNDLNIFGLPHWSFKLPPEVVPLMCDSSACSSQGTYLPGGSRFTVYYQKLTAADAEFPKTIVTDANGKAFVTSANIFLGKPMLKFLGTFTGLTTGGYYFTQMKGVLILVDQKTALGFNHFAPNGISSDFTADDAVFDKIVDTLQQNK
jgi:hypothetical protein